MPEADAEKIMHVSQQISKGKILMGSDVGREWSSSYKQGHNFSISINAATKGEADKLFDGLWNGGEVKMPMKNIFLDDYFGMFTDKSAIAWMVSFNEAQPHN